MRVILLFIFIVVYGFANTITVVDSDMNITIDGREYKYEIGKYPLPHNAIQICYQSGKGKVLVNGDNNRSLDVNSSLSCYQLPQNKGVSFKNIIAKFNKLYHSEVIDINPSVRSAVGKRNISLIAQLTGDIEVEKNISYLIIKSEEFGLPPVKLIVKDKDKKIKFSYENSDNNVSVFIIEIKKIEDNDFIEVINNSGDIVLKRKIILDNI